MLHTQLNTDQLQWKFPFHQSGSIAHLVTPIKSKAGGAWAAVQRRRSLLQCGNTINLHLHLLQAILVPVLQFLCQVWGMQSPQVAAANNACAALQPGSV